MNKKLLIWILSLVLLSSLAYAYASYDATNNPLNATRVFNFDSGDCSDGLGIEGCTNNGGFYASDTFFDSGGSVFYNGSDNSYLDTNFCNGDWNMLSPFTIVLWVRTNETNDHDDRWFGMVDSATEQTYYLRFHSNTYGYYGGIESAGGENAWITGNNVDRIGYADTAWKMLTFSHDGTGKEEGLKYYANDTLQAVNLKAGNDAASELCNEDLFVFALSTDGADSNNIKGYLDEVLIFGYELSSTNISDLWNGTFAGGGAPPPASGGSINISNGFPLNGESFNYYTIDMNATVNASNTWNATLWIGWANQTPTQNITLYNYLNGTEVPINFTMTFPGEGNVTWYINVSSGDDGSQTPSKIFYLDTTDPAITTNFLNQSFYFTTNMTAWFNFTDNLALYSVNISIDSTQIFGATNIINDTLNYYLNRNMDGLSVGEHTISVRVADGHTASALAGEYDWTNGLFNNYLRFNFYDGGYARIDGEGFFDSFQAARKTDRYTFDYEPSSVKNSYVFKVTSDQGIDIITKPGHYGGQWLVIGDHWLDFDLPNVKISTKRINANEIDVTVSSFEAKALLTFNSIGDLNIVTQNYTFYTTNASTSFSSPLMEKTLNDITFFINKTGSITSTSAALYYNNTLKTVTKTSYPEYDRYLASVTTPTLNAYSADVPINWTYSIYGTVLNESGSIFANQTVYQIGIDNCSNASYYPAANMTFRLESDNSLIYVDTAGYFETWISDIDEYRSFNLTWSNITAATICIYPPWAAYNLFGQLEYQDVPGSYTKKTYYFQNTSIDNATAQYTLYLTNGTTPVTFTVLDENDNEIENVYIKILSYNLPTDSYVTTEILKTDSDGVGIGQIILNTQWYQFLLEYNGVVVLLTSPTKITSTSRTFRINLATDYFVNYDTYTGISSLLTFTNATRTFTYTFSDPTNGISAGCLKITKRTVNADTIINQSCITSTASTISLTIPDPVGTATYIGTGYININPSFITDVISVSFDEKWKEFGLTGVFLSFLIVVTLIMIGLWNPIVAIILMVIGLIMTHVFGFFHLDWEVIISLVVIAGITIYRVSRN